MTNRNERNQTIIEEFRSNGGRVGVYPQYAEYQGQTSRIIPVVAPSRADS